MNDDLHPARRDAVKLVAISVLILFFELVCIRWSAAYIRLLSYFSNFILLAAFLGIGLGVMLARRRIRLLGFFPAACLAYVILVASAEFEIDIETQAQIYFGQTAPPQGVRLGSLLLLPALYLLIGGLFVLLGQEMGRLLSKFPPVKAYTLNLLGSLAGIAAFPAVAFLRWPPAAWFGISFALLIPLLGGRRWLRWVNTGLMGIAVVIVAVMGQGSIWSPYYKLDVHPVPGRGATIIAANGVTHQVMLDINMKPPLYMFPYGFFPLPPADVLVIGAGTGTDTAAALATGAGRVDAVDIDATIVDIGRELNPNAPYADPRVNVEIDDARTFMQRSDTQYDLIVFGLIDSLTLQSSYSSIRLENYIFTREAFEDVRRHLKPDGLLAVYNYFREPWLVGKIAGMMSDVFGEDPRVIMLDESGSLAMLLAGPRARTIDPVNPGGAGAFAWERGIIGATDDWPFLYMRNPGMPGHYVQFIAIVLALSALSIAAVQPRFRLRISWPFFFLGAAFMLLETRAITRFALLFGSTWLVNSLVFFAILTAVLLANLYVARVRNHPVRLYYALLFIALAAGYLVPLDRLLPEVGAIKYIVASVLAFAPITMAGIVFSSSFKKSTDIPYDFGSNLLGSILGGLLEYTSLAMGYRNLLLLAAVLYALSMWAWQRRR